MLPRRCAKALRTQAKRLYERSIGLATISKDPYATHVPILVGVAAAFSPGLLIEFGSGAFSTLSFLDEVAFPSLERVESYENNKEWFEQVRARLPVDSRVYLRYVEGEMHQVVDVANTSSAGMIFIDDSPTAEARVPTVEAVARRCGTGPIVVLHDNDLWRLRLAMRHFENRISFNAFNPQCCAMWNGHPERMVALRSVDRIIHHYAAKIAVTDTRGWREVFSRELKWQAYSLVEAGSRMIGEPSEKVRSPLRKP